MCIIKNMSTKSNLEMLFEGKDIKPFSPCVKATIKFIKDNYCTDIPLDTISNAVKYNKYYLCRIFKLETGFTIQDFIVSLRISHAKELLANTDMTLTEVVYGSGFSSQSYFCYMFKKAVKITPLRYRKQQKQS